MANPTTAFGWVMPTATDLVTDLPADFAVFGQGVDTSMQYLLGGTTGQVLSKTSATNMAFTWIANDQGDLTAITAGTGISVTSGTGPVPTVAIDTTVTVDKTTAQTLTNKTLTSPALTTPTISTLTTNGDILYGTGSGALSRLGIGTTGQVLNVAGGIPAWTTAAAGDTGPSFSAYRTTTTQSITAATFTKVQLNAEDWDTASAFDSTTNYRFTPQTAGYYTVAANGNVNYTVADCLLVKCYKNGSAWKYLAATDKPTGGGTTAYAGACQVYLNGSTDYIEMYVYSFNSTTAIPTGSAETQFTAALVRTN